MRWPTVSVPKTRLGQFVFFFITEFVSYFLVVANTRAFNQANYIWTCLTDLAFAGMNFLIWRLCIENKDARTLAAGLGYTLGGTSGSLLSIYCTVHVYGK